MIHLLVKASRVWNPSYVRPNPQAPWDWCPVVDLDPFNDEVLTISKDRDIIFPRLIEAGVNYQHVLGIDGVTKDLDWLFARDLLRGVLN